MAPSQNESRPLVCVVDDNTQLSRILCEVLAGKGYRPCSFASATEFLEWSNRSDTPPDLIISDINMPGISGLDLCRAIRAGEPRGVRVPIILITGSESAFDMSSGIEAGADDFIRKPYSSRDLLAKVRSLLEIREQNVSLFRKTQSLQQLTSFVPAQVADLMVADPKHGILKPHRAIVTVLFIDLRRFTAFSSRTEPEEILGVLNRYYTTVGNAATRHNGTLGHLAGDGIMVFFNDPVPVENHQAVATRMAVEIRDELSEQKRLWQERGYDIDFGIGLAEGYATIGVIGYERFQHYSVIGPVTNFASRLCNLADQGQILASHRFVARMGEHLCQFEKQGEVTLKGIGKSVKVQNIVAMAEAEPAIDAGAKDAA